MNPYASPLFIRVSEYLFRTTKESVFMHIAKTILDKIEEFPDVTSEELAFLCNTTPSSISKFCRALSYESFTQLREDFRPYFSDDEAVKLRSEAEIMAHIYATLPLEHCVAVGKELRGKKNIVVISNEYSFNISNILREGLSRNGVRVYQLNRAMEETVLRSFIEKADGIVVISLTGQWLEKHKALFQQQVNYKVVITKMLSKENQQLFDDVLSLNQIKDFFSSNYYSNKYVESLVFNIVSNTRI